MILNIEQDAFFVVYLTTLRKDRHVQRRWYRSDRGSVWKKLA